MTYFLTGSWRMPSAAKKTALSLGADAVGVAAMADAAPPNCVSTRSQGHKHDGMRRDGRDTGAPPRVGLANARDGGALADLGSSRRAWPPRWTAHDTAM